MEQRDSARNAEVLSSQQEDWHRYKVLRNKCNQKVKQDRNLSLKKRDKFLSTNDSKGMYKFAKKKMGWKAGGTPEAFLVDGQMTYNTNKKMADIQVNYFYTKVEKLIQKLPPQTANPLNSLQAALARWGRSHLIPKLKLKTVTPTEVIILIKKHGIDGIDSESTEKYHRKRLQPTIAHINQKFEINRQMEIGKNCPTSQRRD